MRLPKRTFAPMLGFCLLITLCSCQANGPAQSTRTAPDAQPAGTSSNSSAQESPEPEDGALPLNTLLHSVEYDEEDQEIKGDGYRICAVHKTTATDGPDGQVLTSYTYDLSLHEVRDHETCGIGTKVYGVYEEFDNLETDEPMNVVGIDREAFASAPNCKTICVAGVTFASSAAEGFLKGSAVRAVQLWSSSSKDLNACEEAFGKDRCGKKVKIEQMYKPQGEQRDGVYIYGPGNGWPDAGGYAEGNAFEIHMDKASITVSGSAQYMESEAHDSKSERVPVQVRRFALAQDAKLGEGGDGFMELPFEEFKERVESRSFPSLFITVENGKATEIRMQS